MHIVPDVWWIKLDLSMIEAAEGTVCCICMEENIKLLLKMKCSQKHSICENCANHIDKCPVCRGDI